MLTTVFVEKDLVIRHGKGNVYCVAVCISVSPCSFSLYVYPCAYAVNKSGDTTIKLPMVKVNSSFSPCPYAESQPHQLLAVIECSNQDSSTVTFPNKLNITYTVYKEEMFYLRTVLLPSTDVDIVLQQDSSNPRWFYVLLEHVNFVTPESHQTVAPTYHTYVQCTANGSMATHRQPIVFCIKHSKLTTALTLSGNFTYNPATPYFLNIPGRFDVFANPAIGNRQVLLFKIRVGVFYVNVTSYWVYSVAGVGYVHGDSVLVRPSNLDSQVYSLSGKTPFAMGNALDFGELFMGMTNVSASS